MELLTKTEASQPGGGAGDGGEDEVVGLEDVSREHATYDREHEVRSIGVGDDDHFDVDFGRPGSVPLARRRRGAL